MLDPATHAVRADVADVRLADQVFAPHYAAPLRRTLDVTATVRAGRDDASAIVATLAPGDVFDVLDITGGVAWGIAVGVGRVGYIDAAAVHVKVTA